MNTQESASAQEHSKVAQVKISSVKCYPPEIEEFNLEKMVDNEKM